MNKTIRIASGQGFWGDLPKAPIDQVRKGPIDYLVLDYLAEVTMSILQKQKMRNKEHGYAQDFVDVVKEILPDISEKGIKVIANAGGINPEACKDKILGEIERQGLSGLKVAVVDGDNILNNIDNLIEDGHPLENMDTGEPISTVKDQLLSANVYFGCQPIVEALQLEADIVITGRVTDTALTLGPLVHEFGWDFDDYDKISAGTIAGHFLECGAQVTGGNYTDWERVDRYNDIGFPIVEVEPNGNFYVTKHENTGGLVNEQTVKEQLVYEIGDPKEYITPDCIADFTSIQLSQEGPSRVYVYGIEGREYTPTYKVSASYKDGYRLFSTLVYCWPKALKKAKVGGEILRERAKSLDLELEDFRVEYIGVNGCSEEPVTDEMLKHDYDEVQMRVGVAGPSEEDVNRFGKEVVPLILTGPGGVTGYAGGRPKASEVVAYWPALLDKKAVAPRVRVF